MLPDEDIAKLCYGRIIKADFYQSSGKDAAGPHYAVMLDSDEEIEGNDTYYVVVISHNASLDPDAIHPVPGYTGLKGYIQCRWVTTVDLPGIKEVCGKISPPDMAVIERRIRETKAGKKRSTK